MCTYKYTDCPLIIRKHPPNRLLRRSSTESGPARVECMLMLTANIQAYHPTQVTKQPIKVDSVRHRTMAATTKHNGNGDNDIE